MPLLNRFSPNTCHVSVNSYVKYTMHGMGMHDIGKFSRGVGNVDVNCVDVWTCLARACRKHAVSSMGKNGIREKRQFCPVIYH